MTRSEESAKTWSMAFDDSSDKMTPVPSPVSEALILICEKCGKKLASGEDENPSRTIQLALKEHIKSNGQKGVLRAVVSSCMDICPKGEIAVGIVRSGSAPNTFFTYGGKTKRGPEAILAKLRSE